MMAYSHEWEETGNSLILIKLEDEEGNGQEPIMKKWQAKVQK